MWFKAMLITVYLIFITFYKIADGWSDGAPCMHSTMTSMNPLEAEEHQGGLQLTPPPFHIIIRERCYWKGQPIEVTLEGKSNDDYFKGFVIQPFSYRGSRVGKRVGEFLRLDNNGSWRQQCFRFKNSVTHSHEERKKSMKLWWRSNEDDSEHVQFVATVAKSQKEFWVKSIISNPLPPCRLKPVGFTERYIAPPVTAPPPADNFKLETAQLFQNDAE